jgi:hypothetical protein
MLGANIKLASTGAYGRVTPGSGITVKGRVRAALLTNNGTHTPNIEDNEGNHVGKGFLDQERDDLPLEVVVLEIDSGISWCDGIHHWSTRFLILEATMNEAEFRRLGLAYGDATDREDKYMFFGIEKTIITIV